VSGPLLDRFDIVLQVDPLNKDELLGPSDGESSTTVRARVEAARAVQAERYGGATQTNSCGDREAVEQIVQLSRVIKAQLGRALEEMTLSARGMVRTLRVARTIADLDGADAVTDLHVGEALGFRPDPKEGALIA
jgi:magnesium chelatase family protein